MKNCFLRRREEICQQFLKADLSGDLYANVAIFRIANDKDILEAEKNLLFTALWYEHEHPLGRDHKGEPDFVSISLITALHTCYNKISEECRNAIDKFFLTREYDSMHESENHYLMYRVSRLLAAEFYEGRFFEQYGLTSNEIIEEDSKYINEFLDYRAKASWGEFDSGGYAGEIMLILNVLYTYTRDERLKKKAAMMMDIILLDMIVDTKNGLYGGAHGRIYPPNALDSTESTMYKIYCYYFGAENEVPQKSIFKSGILLSDYYPSDIVCKIAKNRKFPYENRERKHLHLAKNWGDGIDYSMLDVVKDCSIDKYTYVCDDYILGAINHQSDYPEAVSHSAWYAHHQQHEWELTLPGDGRVKIFSHHPGDFNEHNHWTGDMHCNCSTHFCTKDTAISMYNIEKPDKLEFINVYIPLEFFSKRKLEENYIFLEYKNSYVMCWFANDYYIATEGVLSSATAEFRSNGRKNAFICHIESKDRFLSFKDFVSKMKNLPVEFNADDMSIEFNGIYVDYKKRSVCGEYEIYPYKLFDSPYVKSDYYSAVYEVTDGEETQIYDFNF